MDWLGHNIGVANVSHLEWLGDSLSERKKNFCQPQESSWHTLGPSSLYGGDSGQGRNHPHLQTKKFTCVAQMSHYGTYTLLALRQKESLDYNRLYIPDKKSLDSG